MAWPEPGSELAFLVLDVDRDGRVTSGKEIFGTHAAGRVPNGYLALIDRFRAVDGPPGGSLHAGHRLYEQLLLWGDRNHDGASDPGELRNARETFTAIGMGYIPLRWRDTHGNQLRFQGWTELRTGGPDQSAAVDPAAHRPRRGIRTSSLPSSEPAATVTTGAGLRAESSRPGGVGTVAERGQSGGRRGAIAVVIMF